MDPMVSMYYACICTMLVSVHYYRIYELCLHVPSIFMLHVIGLYDFIGYPSGIWMASTWLFVAMARELLHRCSFRL